MGEPWRWPDCNCWIPELKEAERQRELRKAAEDVSRLGDDGNSLDD
jgi:hypothetical protein